MEVDSFFLDLLGQIRSFVIKENHSCTVGSKGGQMHLKRTGVTVTLPENAVSEKTNISVSSYWPEDYIETPPAIICVTTVLPHGLMLRKKAAIELRHHLCLEKPFRVRILYHSGLPTCDEGYQLLADLNRGTPSFVDGETEFKVERNCIRILCRGFSKYCVIQEGYFYISVRIYAPLAFTEGESEGSVVASLSCQCDEVTKKIDEDQRNLAGEPKECKGFQNDSINVDSTEKVELSVDPPKDSPVLYSVDGDLSYSIRARALESLIGEGHMNYITRSFFLIKRTEDSSKYVKMNFYYKTFDTTGCAEGQFPLYLVIWRPMPRPLTHRNKAANAGNWLDEVVPPEERLSVAKNIGRYWRHVGEALGPEPKFEPTELDDFEEKDSNRDRARAMLNRWAQKKHKKATRRMLILALKKENQNALISDVFNCDPDSVTAQPPLPPLQYFETSKGYRILFL